MNGKTIGMTLVIVIGLVIAIAPLATAQAIDTANVKTSEIFELRDFSNPISASELKGWRDQAIADFRKLNTAKNKPIAGIGGGDLKFPKNAKIVAYYYKIDENGVPHEFVGLAENPESVSITQLMAKEWIANETSGERGSALLSSDWEYVWSSGAFYTYYPYGGVGNNIEIERKPLPTKDYFGVHQVFQQSPGWVLWSWSPTGTINGPTASVSAGLTPPTFTWSFPIGFATLSDGATNPATKTAKWTLDIWGPDRLKTQIFEPGSSIQVNRWSGRSTLGYYYSKGRFEDLNNPFDWGECWYYWYCWWEYY